MDTTTKLMKWHLTRPEAAEYLGLCTQTLAAWATQGRGPMYLKLGRAVRYRQRDLDEFVGNCEVHTDAE